jgi:pSer/pThr/pTyr-binding forkhead associated (FHA) protein
LIKDRESLLKKMTPLAVLKAITSEAKRATTQKCLDKDIIGIWQFPFRIGRESRFKKVNGIFVVFEREKKATEKPNNDFYLVDHEEYMHISREHFQIEKKGDSYFIKDRKSTCGTMVNDKHLCWKNSSYKHELKDGDIITVGSENSPYKFQFIAL